MANNFDEINIKKLIRTSKNEKFWSWFQGRRDAIKCVPVLSTSDQSTDAIRNLAARGMTDISLIDAEFRNNANGYFPKIRKIREISKPEETNILGPKGRAWKHYEITMQEYDSAIEAILNLSSKYRNFAMARRSKTQALVNTYVRTLKRHHPERHSFADWKPTIPDFTDKLWVGKPSDLLLEEIKNGKISVEIPQFDDFQNFQFKDVTSSTLEKDAEK
jgi:hypothetical protein